MALRIRGVVIVRGDSVFSGGPVPPFSPSELTSLKGWWKTDTGLSLSGTDILTLSDETGGGRTLTKTNQGALSGYPQAVAAGKGGKTVARWNGTATTGLRGSWLAADWAVGWSGTISVACQLSSLTETGIIEFASGTTVNQGASLIRHPSGGKDLFARRLITDTGVADSSTAWRVITTIMTPTSCSLRIDGVEVASSTAAATMNDLNNVQIGCLFGGIYPITGDIGEVVVCSSALSGADLTNLETYLAERWV